jgi:DNA-binding NtrC family response regulator
LQDNAALRSRAGEFISLDQIVGESPKMRELRQLIRTVAGTDARVLILGESGTGKELVAGAIHSLSSRRNQHYVRINCAAIPETLLESELFGHEKGAFTGAVKQKLGRVEEANNGTIFLDEIADMGKPLQAKLLRFLEDGTFTRVGGTEELRVNLRLVAATNRDIAQAIAAGDFREDLFHRLNVVQFNLPPLRERGDDVLLLANHFLKSFRAKMGKSINGFTPAAQQKLLAQRWPGNVRELRNALERAAAVCSGQVILPTHLPAELKGGPSPPAKIESCLDAALTPWIEERIANGVNYDTMHDELEARLLSALLPRYENKPTLLARALDMNRATLRKKLRGMGGDTGEGEE